MTVVVLLFLASLFAFIGILLVYLGRDMMREPEAFISLLGCYAMGVGLLALAYAAGMTYVCVQISLEVIRGYL